MTKRKRMESAKKLIELDSVLNSYLPSVLIDIVHEFGSFDLGFHKYVRTRQFDPTTVIFPELSAENLASEIEDWLIQNKLWNKRTQHLWLVICSTLKKKYVFSENFPDSPIFLITQGIFYSINKNLNLLMMNDLVHNGDKAYMIFIADIVFKFFRFPTIIWSFLLDLERYKLNPNLKYEQVESYKQENLKWTSWIINTQCRNISFFANKWWDMKKFLKEIFDSISNIIFDSLWVHDTNVMHGMKIDYMSRDGKWHIGVIESVITLEHELKWFVCDYDKKTCFPMDELVKEQRIAAFDTWTNQDDDLSIETIMIGDHINRYFYKSNLGDYTVLEIDGNQIQVKEKSNDKIYWFHINELFKIENKIMRRLTNEHLFLPCKRTSWHYTSLKMKFENF